MKTTVRTAMMIKKRTWVKIMHERCVKYSEPSLSFLLDDDTWAPT